MAFYAVNAPYTTTKKKKSQSSVTEPNVIHYEGTWDATDGGVILGDIDLTDTTVTNLAIAATHILRCGVFVDTGTASDQMCYKPNVSSAAGAAKEGNIAIMVCVNDNKGTWWADVVT